MSVIAAARKVRPQDESGMTVVELTVAMTITAIIVTAFLGVLASVQTSLARENVRSQTMDQGRLAMQALDREIRSGSVLYDPAAASTPYYRLRVYTQSNATPRCVEWRVATYAPDPACASSKCLLRREWTSGSNTATSWRVVATNIVNSGSAAGQRPFQLDTSAAAGYGSSLGSRVVDVTLLVNAKPGDPASTDVRVESSLSIRNQSTGDPCSPVPTG
jgi:type II secretory pathway pseudopilin PulG